MTWTLFAAVVFALIEGLILADILDSYYQVTLITICINIILALSLNLIIGYNGQFSLGHAGFMAIGAYLGKAAQYYGVVVGNFDRFRYFRHHCIDHCDPYTAAARRLSGDRYSGIFRSYTNRHFEYGCYRRRCGIKQYS